MAVIAKNECIAPGIWRMEVAGAFSGKAGQFYMLRPTDTLDPLLGRPISIHDLDEEKIVFVYHVVGRGTSMLSAKRAGDPIVLQGPYGNGFSDVDADMTIVGGGIGVAPLYLLAKEHKRRHGARKTRVYLGFTKDTYLIEAFKKIADEVYCNVGGFITDDVDFSRPGIYCTCGPEPMLYAAHARAREAGAELFVSLERRMACGAGACLGCSIPTRAGNRRVCKDGPVFPAREVFDVQ